MRENLKKHIKDVERNRRWWRKLKSAAAVFGLLVALGMYCYATFSGLALETGGTNEAGYQTGVGTSEGEELEDATINTRLSVQILASGSNKQTDINEMFKAEGEAGETLYARVISTYSRANDEGETVEVAIRVGELPEGVNIAGFDENGEKKVVVSGEENQIVTLHLTEDENGYLITYEQISGDTLEFILQFNSRNGIMERESSVTLKVDEEKIEGLNGDVGENDQIGGTATLVWTASNEWEPVDKKVNGADENQIVVTNENTLSGTLNYDITARSSNREDYGEIWTEYIKVADTLTLSEGISFPEKAKVNENGDGIVIEDENGGEQTVLYFGELQGGRVTSLTLSEDRRSVTYEIEVPNSYMTDGVPTQEQDDLALKMVLNAGNLALSEGYSEQLKTEESIGKIENKVEIEPIPYKDYDTQATTDTVFTTPVLNTESFTLEKKAETEQKDYDNTYRVVAGQEITYTITLTNTGSSDLKVQDEEGNYYAVTDELPRCLDLTEAQQKALKDQGAECSYSDAAGCWTVTWIPSRSDIPAGEKYELSFAATVKELNDPSMNDMWDWRNIDNTAEYKGQSATASVRYRKAALTIKKEVIGSSENEEGYHNGEEVQYQITIENTSDIDSAMNEIVKDILPEGLEFRYAVDGNGSHVSESTNGYVVHPEDTTENAACPKKHIGTFDVDGRELTWNVGVVKAKEKITLTYICTVNTDELTDGDKTKITNKATIEDKESEGSIDVDYPIDLNKQVEEDTSTAYEDGHVFRYTLTVTNDEKNPSKKEELILTDTMAPGLVPNSDLYGVSGGNSEQISWDDYVSGNGSVTDSNGNSYESFYTELDGYRAVVTMENSQIVLTFDLSESPLVGGGTVSIRYEAKIKVTDPNVTTAFPNKAEIDGIEKSVTVYGGKAVGNLHLSKWFMFKEGTTPGYDTTKREYEEACKNVIFKISGVDHKGETIWFEDESGNPTDTMTIRVGDKGGFYTDWYGHCWGYTIENLPVGTYTVTEENAEIDGKSLTTSWEVSEAFKGEEENQIKVLMNDTSGMKITNTYNTGAYIDVQKSVWALGAYKDSYWLNLQPGKEIFALDQDSTTEEFVVYNITVVNTGGDSITLEGDFLVDSLPEGVTYLGIGTNPSVDRGNWRDEAWIWASSLNTYNNAYNHILATTVKAAYNENDNQVAFSIKEGSDNELKSNQSISFLMCCRISEDVTAEEPLTNTVKLYVDSKVEHRDYADGTKEIETRNTPYDENQNNGSTKDEGIEETIGKRVISSSVTITPKNVIVPGISKDAVAYIPTGTKNEIALADENTNITPQSAVKWEITLYNDGTKSMTDYEVDDSVTGYFHMLTKAEAEKFGISAAYKIGIYNYDGSLLWSKDISDKVFEELGEQQTSEYTFTFQTTSTEWYAIPAGGYAVLTMYTNNNIEAFQIYKNTAVLRPLASETEILYNGVKHGEVVKENDIDIGVTASDEVHALGEFASISWKTITETGNEGNTASCRDEKNHIYVDAGTNVTYTNNIRNTSDNDFVKVVIVDTMPAVNDTGVVNQNDARGSQFEVSFAENLVVSVLDREGNVTALKEGEDYRIEFSRKTSYSDSDFEGEESENWHEEWSSGDKSFRVVMLENFVLKSRNTLVIQYDGKVAATAAPGAVAWNSFGYRYYYGRTSLTAEPPKVGVKIPNVPIIKKVVVDTDEQLQTPDANRNFTFELWDADAAEKIAVFEISQGGYKELSALKDVDGNEIELERGKSYTIKEAELPEGYTLLGIGKEGTELNSEEYTFTYYEEEAITIVAKNEVDRYRAELPGTGGIGTTGYTTGGALLLLAASLIGGYRLRQKRRGGR